ncbi:TPR-like protein [Rhizoctonia solani]|uniref:TPR-like protein n=1 Tax=Rhizoctonia solani TaxID=456999 RepID=A0A8H7I4C0_9AGAM|nr:TPR-like protein [Rhizoctonia solani]
MSHTPASTSDNDFASGGAEAIATARELISETIQILESGNIQSDVEILLKVLFITNTLIDEFQNTGHTKYLDIAIEGVSHIVHLMPETLSDMTGVILALLGPTFLTRFEQLAKIEDLKQTVDCLIRARSLGEEMSEDVELRLNAIGFAYTNQFDISNDPTDLDIAVIAFSGLVTLTSDDQDGMREYLNNLGQSYQTRFQQRGDMDDINHSIAAYTKAKSITPEAHNSFPVILNGLSTSYLIRLERTGNPSDVSSAISHCEHAVKLTPQDHPDLSNRLCILGDAWASKFQHFGDVEALNQAINYQEESLSIPRSQDAPSLVILNNLGNKYKLRFRRLGNTDDLDRAIKYYNQTVLESMENDALLPFRLANLASAYCARSSYTHTGADIQTSVHLIKQALSIANKNHKDWPSLLSNAGTTYKDLFEETGNIHDIDTSIQHLSEAISGAPQDHYELPMWLSNIGGSYQHRFEYLKHTQDIDKAVEFHSRAVSLTPKGYPELPLRLHNLGASYQVRFNHTGQTNDLNDAICFKLQASELVQPDHSDRSAFLANLGTSYISRFGISNDLNDLELATKYGSEALELTPDNHVLKMVQYNNLGNAYTTRFEELEDIASLEKSIELKKEAVSRAPPDHVYLPVFLLNLGTSQQRFFEKTGDKSFLDSSLDIFSRTAQHPTGHPFIRFGAALKWARLSLMHKASADLEAYVSANALNIRDLEDIAAEAAAAAIKVQKYEMALEWLEAGRSIVRNQMLQLRTPLDTLSATHPDLADELHTISKKLYSAGLLNLSESSSKLVDIERSAQQQHQLAKRYKDIIALIRQKSGFEQRSASRRPDLSFQEEQAQDNRHDAQSAMSTLWHTMTKCVLASLGYGLPPEGALPHITWCTTGVLSQLPIHASGDYNNPDTRLYNYAISSYVATIGSINPKTSSNNETKLLAICQADTPGQSNLPGTIEELSSIRECIQKPLELTEIQGPDVTAQVVLDAMDKHDWVHLACHAEQNVHEPAESGFFFHGGLLTLSAIIGKSFKSKGLAFLSACQTAKGYANVIATLWSVMDDDAPVIAMHVYKLLLRDGRMKGELTAEALHLAVGELRELVGETAFERWAPFVHIGS